MTILVDSNVLLDVLGKDPAWFGWSSTALNQASQSTKLMINPVIYAEVSINFRSIEEIDAALPSSLMREQIPFDAAFLAGKAFLTYRRQGGSKSSPLPDFFIGAHAIVAGYALLTRDPKSFRSYFPGLELIAPAAPPPH
jgi:predicted nucleic acid-binding protein